MPYRVEYAKTGRSTCNGGCKDGKEKQKIEKGGMRCGTWVEIKEHGSWQWRHWGCVTPRQLQNMATDFDDDPEALDGYEDMNDEDQARIRKAFIDHVVPDEDVTPAMAENQAEKEKAAKEKAASKEADKKAKEAKKAQDKVEKEEAKQASKNKKKADAEEKKAAKKKAKDDEDEEEVVPAKKKRSRAKEESEDEEPAPAPAPAPKKRGRVKKEEPESPAEAPAKAVEANSGARRRSKKKAEEPVTNGKAKGPGRKSSRSTKA